MGLLVKNYCFLVAGLLNLVALVVAPFYAQ
mgnify:CR=1 FL=1